MVAQFRETVKTNCAKYPNYFSIKYYILRLLPMHQDTLHPYLKAIRKPGQLYFPGLSLLAHAQRTHSPQFRTELPCSALTYSTLRTAPQTCSWYGSVENYGCIGGEVPP